MDTFNVYLHSFSNGLASAITSVLIYPFESARIRYQILPSKSNRDPPWLLSYKEPVAVGEFLASFLREILLSASSRAALYKGVVIKILATCSSHIFYMFFLLRFERFYKSKVGEMNFRRKFSVGMVLAMLTRLWSVPLEVYGMFLRLSPFYHRAMLQTLPERTNGFSTFYKTFGTSLILSAVVPCSSILYDYFCVLVRTSFWKYLFLRKPEKLPISTKLVLWILTKMCITILFYPFIMTKTLILAKHAIRKTQPVHEHIEVFSKGFDENNEFDKASASVASLQKLFGNFHRNLSLVTLKPSVLRAASFCFSETTEPLFSMEFGEFPAGEPNVLELLVSMVMQGRLRGMYRGLQTLLIKTAITAFFYYCLKKKLRPPVATFFRWLEIHVIARFRIQWIQDKAAFHLATLLEEGE